MDAFYHRAAGGTFEATDATTSPWDERFQHAGPPLALIARLVDERFANPAMRIGRMTLEIFGPIPKVDLALETRVLRPGKRIELIEARLRSGGKEVAVANVWRFARLGENLVPPSTRRAEPARLPGPEARLEMFIASNGYFRAFEWRFAAGSSRELGPAAVWCRTDLPLIFGEPKEARDLVLSVADSANGISAALDPRKYMFVPVELTVSTRRAPRTEWVGMRAETLIEDDGIGQTRADLFDEEGYLGVATQTLFVAPRADV